jgi:hypothetical protein
MWKVPEIKSANPHEKAQQLQRKSAQHISWQRPASSAGCMPRCVVFFKSQCIPAAGGVACALAGQSGGVALLGLRSHSNLNAAPCEKTAALFFECFPYVCPEPVLVK